jgi:hypothetical protein
MSTKDLYLLDRNIVSIIKDAVMGVTLSEPKKLTMLNKLKEIDVSTSAVSPILSLIEGQKGRDESYDEKIACVRKETEAIKSFFRQASTDSCILQTGEVAFSSTFTEYREEDWDRHSAFLVEACSLLRNKVAKSKSEGTKRSLLSLAKNNGVYLGHISVVACLSCLYGSEAARGVLKPHKITSKCFNVLNDLLTLSRVNLIKAIAQACGMNDLKVQFLTLDEGLNELLSNVQIRAANLTPSGVSQTVEYAKPLFPLLDENEYITLLSEIC